MRERAWETIRREIDLGVIPGAVASVSHRGRRGAVAAGYISGTKTEEEAVTVETMYDCASLTKVTVTLPLTLQLIDRGILRLNDPIANWFPAFEHKSKKEVTVRHLLTHTSGLPSHLDLHSHGWAREEIIMRASEAPLAIEPGTQVVYSDIGFILLGEIASRLCLLPLEQAAKRYIFDPLGMKSSKYCPPPSKRGQAAATEWSDETGDFWRGIVHDENARAMGGVSGHAGLFSTAGDLLRYAEMWLSLSTGAPDERAVLSEAAVRIAIVTQTPAGSGTNRGLGWVLKGDRMDASGDYSSPRAYSHTGFTGTSLYIDPTLELAAVLLTNRVHFGRDKSVTRLRETFYNAVVASL